MGDSVMARPQHTAGACIRRLVHDTILVLFVLFILWMSYQAIDGLVHAAWERSDGHPLRFLAEMITAILKSMVPLLLWWGIFLALAAPFAWFHKRRLNRRHPDLAAARSFPDTGEPIVRLAPGKLFLFRDYSPDIIPLGPLTALQFGTENTRVFLRVTQGDSQALIYWLPGTEEEWQAVYDFLQSEADAYRR